MLFVCDPQILHKHCFQFLLGVKMALPWVPEVFLACGGNFRCWPKANTSSAVGRSREKNARVTIKTWQKPETALEKSLAPRVKWPKKKLKKKCLCKILGSQQRALWYVTVFFGVVNIVPERLAERVWWTKSQSLLLNINFRLSRFQSSLLFIHLRYGRITVLWHRTFSLCDILLSRWARRSFAPLQKWRQNTFRVCEQKPIR